jgi:hypothetical protein
MNNIVISSRLPKEIRMFSKTYKVIYVKKLKEVDISNIDHEKTGSIIYGTVDFLKNEITLFKGKGFPKEDIWHYLIHEINHIIEYELSIDFKKDISEKIIDNFAMGFLHFLVENRINISGKNN